MVSNVNIMIAACRVEVGYAKNIWANIGRNIVHAAPKVGAISEGIYMYSIWSQITFPHVFKINNS